MRALTEKQIQAFKEDGYLHIPNVFTDDEVESFRKGCQKNLPGDSMCRPEFLNIMFSPKVINVMKDLLGEEVIYPGLSLTRTNDSPKKFGSRLFHTDTMGDDLDFSQSFPVINTGIYLQDHVNYSGCLKIIPGSHKRPCITSPTILEAIKNILRQLRAGNIRNISYIFNLHHSVNIKSMPRDLIVWYARTHHSGYGVRLRFFKNISLPPIIENWIPSFLRIPDHPERNVMLSIFAAPSKYLETYIHQQITKERRKSHYLNNACLESEEKRGLAKKAGVSIRNDGYLFHSGKRFTNLLK